MLKTKSHRFSGGSMYRANIMLVASAVGARSWDSQQGRSVLQELLAVK